MRNGQRSLKQEDGEAGGRQGVNEGYRAILLTKLLVRTTLERQQPQETHNAVTRGDGWYCKEMH